jgi:hypothetical protein
MVGGSIEPLFLAGGRENVTTKLIISNQFPEFLDSFCQEASGWIPGFARLDTELAGA